jgi:predicted transcriptional regulator
VTPHRAERLPIKTNTYEKILITMNGLTQYLNEMKAELQELYEGLDHELRSTNNQDLIDDSYFSVTSKLETTLSELDTLINDVDNGVYTDPIEGHGTLEDEE